MEVTWGAGATFGATVAKMKAVMYSVEGLSAYVAELADEMAEDPRCRLLMVGADTSGTVLMSAWDDEVADEVADGLEGRNDGGSVRRLDIPEGMVIWR